MPSHDSTNELFRLQLQVVDMLWISCADGMDREKFTVSVEIIAAERFEVSSLLIPGRYFARSVSRKRLMWYDVELRVVNKEEVSNFCNQCDGRKRYSLRRDKCNCGCGMVRWQEQAVCLCHGVEGENCNNRSPVAQNH